MEPILSVIIPAYNEEKYIEKTLKILNLSLAEIPEPSEIIVVNNNSTDKTEKIALANRAKVVFEPHNQISKARNTGAKHAKGKYLIFLDADTLLPPNVLLQTMHNLNTGFCAGGGALFDMDIPEDKKWQRKFLNFFIKIAKKKQIAAGCFIYCLKKAFEEINGFNEFFYASEEIWFSKNLKKWAKKNQKDFRIITEDKVFTSSRKFNNSGQLILGTITGIVLPFSVFSRTLCWLWYNRKD